MSEISKDKSVRHMIRTNDVFVWLILFALSLGTSVVIAQESAERKLQNGFYPVSGEAATRSEALKENHACIALIYDGKDVDSTYLSSPQFVAIDTSSFVPLILAGSPTALKDGSGRTLLGVTLAKKYVGRLETFTKAHLGGKVAIVLDGEIITMHKIRSVISEGKIQITRCYDNACEVLLSKLTK